MDKKKARQRIEKLKKEINHHRYLYHVLDRQEITDSALDSLKHELADLEQQYPEFITLDSPTQRVGGKPLEKFEKVRHSVPMLSLSDAFSREELKSWEERIGKLVPGEKLDYFVELKIDGFAITLIYENGILVCGATRGDGKIGEDVTQNLKTIESIPLRIHKKPSGYKNLYKGKLEVRGEIFMSKAEFDKVNKKRQKQGLGLYANPRNLAAGSVRQLDSKIAASRSLDSYLYDVVTGLGQKTHQEEHKILAEMGFKTSKYTQYCKNLDAVINYCKSWVKKRDKLPFQVDGVVVVVNNNNIFNRLGTVGKAPRGMIAYKFPAEQATTIVEDIKVQVGRTGALTPVAVLKPVQVAGSTISRATLHNEDEIKRKDVQIGDTVIIQKAGDVIPEVVQVLPSLRPKDAKKFTMPSKCPFCGLKVVRPKGEAVTRCINKNCFATKRREIIHFISKAAFDIDGLGKKIIDQLMQERLISDAVDLFILKQGDLEPLERFAEKSASNIIKAISESKKISLGRFLFALGIRHVGELMAFDLAEHFGSLDKIKNSSLEELESIEGVGEKVAKSIYGWFHNKRNLNFLKRLKDVGIKIKQPPKAKVQGKLAEKTFVLTGSLEKYSRDDAKRVIQNLGGKILNSVSKSTDFVVAGKDPGSKYNKAKKLRVKIINESTFIKMIK